MTISNAQCRDNPPGTYTDIPNLYFRVQPRKRKDGTPYNYRYWFYKVVQDGKPYQRNLGSWPKVSRDAARTEAMEMAKLWMQGVNPVIEVRERKQQEREARRKAKVAASAMTFNQCAEALIVVKTPSWTDERAPATWRRVLSSYVYPHFGDKQVADIDRADVLAFAQPIWDSKHQTARKAFQWTSAVIDYAIEIGERTTPNPANLKHFKQALPNLNHLSNQQPGLDYRDAPRFLRELAQKRGDGAKGLAWILLTGSRSGQTYKMTWDEVDLDKGVWTVPPSHMKGKNPPPFQVPLNDDLVAFLRSLPRKHRTVFKNTRGRQLSNAAFLQVMKRMGYKEPNESAPAGQAPRLAVPHGLRSTVATYLADSPKNHNAEIIKAALSHSGTLGEDSAVYRKYMRGQYVERRRQTMQDWWDYLAASEVLPSLYG